MKMKIYHMRPPAASDTMPARHTFPASLPLLALAPSLAAVLLWAGFSAMIAVTDSPPSGRVYTAASLRTALAHDRTALLDHPLRVRASVGVCTTWVSRCFDWQPALVDTRGPRVAQPFLLGWDTPPPLWTLVRRIPLLSHVIPAPQPVQWGVPATYRITLHVVSGTYCGTGPCLRADLLNADQPTE